MELLVIVVIIFVIYGAGWIWQTVADVFRDIRRTNWEGRVYGQVASPRSIKRTLGGLDVGRLRETFQRFSELHDGDLHDRQLFESPKVSFVRGSARGLLSIYESSDADPRFYTQITLTVPPGWAWRLEVFPQRFRDDDVKYLNVEDIRLGDEKFDPRYVVKSNDPRFAREFLDPAARQGVEDLRNLLGNDRVLLSVNASRLMVRKPSIIGELGDLTAFSELCFRLHDRLLAFGQRAEGIEILEDDASAASADPVCQVCGAAIPRDRRVYCRRCRTPHHDDCWEFNGQCSTYACGESRSSLRY